MPQLSYNLGSLIEVVVLLGTMRLSAPGWVYEIGNYLQAYF